MPGSPLPPFLDTFKVIINIIFIWVSHTSTSWWFSIGFWVTSSLLKPPGLFSLFWSILIMLQSGLSPLVLLFPSPFINQLEIVPSTPITIVITITLMFSSLFFLARSSYLLLISISFNFILSSTETANIHFLAGTLYFFVFLFTFSKVWSSGWD